MVLTDITYDQWTGLMLVQGNTASQRYVDKYHVRVDVLLN